MAQPIQGETVFRSEVELVVLNAAVFDQKQQLVTGLPREAFQLFQDGKPQPIHQFSSRDIPVSLGILVDSSASMTNKRSAVNAAALALVRASNPEDEVFILNFKDTVELAQDYTADITALEQALYDGRIWGGTAVLDAVHTGIGHLRKAQRDKKVLLAITDGEDDSSKMQLAQLLSTLRQEEVTVYAIGILSAEPSRQRKNAEKMLQAIAEVSGGVAYFPRSVQEVNDLAARIAHDIRNQYVLAFAVPAGTKPGFHAVKVQARGEKPGKLTVRTRSGYFYEPASPSR